MLPRLHTFSARERPLVDVLITGSWHEAVLHGWSLHDDGTWWGQVEWRALSEAQYYRGTFPSSRIRTATRSD